MAGELQRHGEFTFGMYLMAEMGGLEEPQRSSPPITETKKKNAVGTAEGRQINVSHVQNSRLRRDKVGHGNAWYVPACTDAARKDGQPGCACPSDRAYCVQTGL